MERANLQKMERAMLEGPQHENQQHNQLDQKQDGVNNSKNRLIDVTIKAQQDTTAI